jgi:hypothetical protein
VPIVVVFTQFDILVSRMEERLSEEEMDKSEEDIENLCTLRADDEFKKLCEGPLEKLKHKLKLPWVTTSGMIIRIESAFVILFDIYILLSSASAIPIDFSGPYQCYTKSGGALCGRGSLDYFCDGSESQCTSQSPVLHRVGCRSCSPRLDLLTCVCDTCVCDPQSWHET